MAKFRVLMIQEWEADAEVEASSTEEAQEIAESLDEDAFTLTDTTYQLDVDNPGQGEKIYLVYKVLTLTKEVRASSEEDAVELVTKLDDRFFTVLDCDYAAVDRSDPAEKGGETDGRNTSPNPQDG